MSRFDATLNPMEEMRFLVKYHDMAASLAKITHFTFDEVCALLLIYYKIQIYETFDPKGITRDHFTEICHCCLDMTEMHMVSRIISCLDDKHRDYYITKEFFVKSFSLLLRGTLEERMEFAYKIYDTTQCGLLGKDHLFKLLRTSIKSNTSESDAEEVVKDMVEVIIKKFDLDKDSKISYNDYRQTVIREPVLLEFLGQCFPSRHTTHKFLSTFTENTKIRFFKLKGLSIM